jgi:hypothetical protein
MTDQQVSSFSLYEEMKMRGVNLTWYDRCKHPKVDGNIPLESERCSWLSIYLLKRDGSLWSVKYNGEAYCKVREAERRVPRDVYVCARCKQQFNEMPVEHREKPDELGTT